YILLEPFRLGQGENIAAHLYSFAAIHVSILSASRCVWKLPEVRCRQPEFNRSTELTKDMGVRMAIPPGFPRTAILNGIAATGKQTWAGGWAQDANGGEYVFLEGRKIGDTIFDIYNSVATLSPPYGRVQGVCPNLNVGGSGFWAVGHSVQNSLFGPPATYGVFRTLILRSSGQGWKRVDSPNISAPNGPVDNWLCGVTAPYANAAWAVGVQGDFGSAPGLPQTAMIL